MQGDRFDRFDETAGAAAAVAGDETTAATGGIHAHGGVGGQPRLPPARPDTIYVIRKEHPQVQLTWASRFPSKVDNLKIRKEVHVFPIKVTLKADYNTETRDFSYGCTAKDVIFGGRISLNVPDQSIEYRKRVHMPNGTQLVFAGSCAWQSPTRRLHPSFGVALEFGGETTTPLLPNSTANAVWAGNHFDVRHRFTIARGLGAEVCGGVSLPVPTARYTHSSGTLSLGEGAFHLHVQEVNAVLKL